MSPFTLCLLVACALCTSTLHVAAAAAAATAKAGKAGHAKHTTVADPTSTVLFIGDSLMIRNNLPETFVLIGKSQGRVIVPLLSLSGGYALVDQVQSNHVLDLIAANNFSTVIVQEQSRFLSMGYAFYSQVTFPAAQAIYSAVMKKSPTPRFILMETWGYLDGYYGNGDTYYTMQVCLGAVHGRRVEPPRLSRAGVSD